MQTKKISDPVRTDLSKARPARELQGAFSGACRGGREGERHFHISLQTQVDVLLVSGQAGTYLGFHPSSPQDLTCTEKSYHTSLKTY